MKNPDDPSDVVTGEPELVTGLRTHAEIVAKDGVVAGGRVGSIGSISAFRELGVKRHEITAAGKEPRS